MFSKRNRIQRVRTGTVYLQPGCKAEYAWEAIEGGCLRGGSA